MMPGAAELCRANAQAHATIRAHERPPRSIPDQSRRHARPHRRPLPALL